MQSVGDKQAEIRQHEEGIKRCDTEKAELDTKRNDIQNKLKELQRTEGSVKRQGVGCAAVCQLSKVLLMSSVIANIVYG